MTGVTMLRQTDRSRLRRKRERGTHDSSAVSAILDQALVCHLGFVVDGRPVVIPTTFVRIEDSVYVHGAPANAALHAAEESGACLTATLLDGLVLARSAFHHSMNYRSVVLFGLPTRVEDPDEKREALLALVERMSPGRSGECRLPTDEELRATLVLRLPIDEGSAKIREGGPIDDEADLALPHWAGVIPLSLVRGVPVPD
jgi:nitroimidazol reductase NimA-like FMN-containing flavoprotein (pyridoxamine 5'-phosphate oxidase superfamily)